MTICVIIEQYRVPSRKSSGSSSPGARAPNLSLKILDFSIPGFDRIRNFLRKFAETFAQLLNEILNEDGVGNIARLEKNK